MVLKGASVLSILEMAAVATAHIGVMSPLKFVSFYPLPFRTRMGFSSEKLMIGKPSVRCSEKGDKTAQRTCKNCKNQFDPLVNHPRACRFHTAHFGGETKRKFESVYSGGTLDTPGSGKVLQYWHCCGSEDPFDPGCTASPHASYDD